MAQGICGFPSRLSQEAFPRGFSTGLSHVPPWCDSILGLMSRQWRENRFPWNGLRHLRDSGNGGTTLEFLSPFLSWSAKTSRRSRRISRGGALHKKGERNSRVVPPFPESPRYLRPFQGNLLSLHCLDFQAEDRLTPRWHVGQPCGKASWDSLVGNPRGKATDPLIHAKGSVTLLLQLGRKTHVHAPTRDED